MSIFCLFLLYIHTYNINYFYCISIELPNINNNNNLPYIHRKFKMWIFQFSSKKKHLRWSCLRWHHRRSIIDTVMRFPQGDWKCPEDYIYALLRKFICKKYWNIEAYPDNPFIVEMHIFWNVGRVFFHCDTILVTNHFYCISIDFPNINNNKYLPYIHKNC